MKRGPKNWILKYTFEDTITILKERKKERLEVLGHCHKGFLLLLLKLQEEEDEI